MSITIHDPIIFQKTYIWVLEGLGGCLDIKHNTLLLVNEPSSEVLKLNILWQEYVKGHFLMFKAFSSKENLRKGSHRRTKIYKKMIPIQTHFNTLIQIHIKIIPSDYWHQEWWSLILYVELVKSWYPGIWLNPSLDIMFKVLFRWN